MPIPRATISFHGNAIVHPAESPEVGALLDELGSLLPADRRTSAAIIEIAPEAVILTNVEPDRTTHIRPIPSADARLGVPTNRPLIRISHPYLQRRSVQRQRAADNNGNPSVAAAQDVAIGRSERVHEG